MFVTFKGRDNEDIKGEVIRSEPQLKRLARKLKKVDEFAFDTETTSLRVQWKGEVELVGISICFGKHNTYYIPLAHFFDDNQLDRDLVLKYLKPAFQRKDIRIIGHNLKFDMHVMACFDVLIQTNDLFDTMIGSWTIDENEQKGLKHLTNLVYDIGQEKFEACLATVTKEEKKAYGLKGSQKPPFHLVRIPVGAPYALADAYWTWRHYVDWQLDELKNEEVEKIYYSVMIPFLQTLYKMERRGVNVNRKRLLEMQKKAEKDLADLEYDIVEIAGVSFNIGSSQQLGELLFGYKKFNKEGNYVGNINLVENSFGFPMQGTTAGGAPSTGEGALKSLTKINYKKDKRKQEGIEMVKLILKYKKLAKLKSAFIDGLLGHIYKDGKIHPTFNLGGASSGRLSCSQSNLQQLPRPIEMPDEPKREKFDSEEAYKKAMRKYKADKEEADFWKFYEIRDLFIPDDIHNQSIIALDFSNLEMRLLAHFSNDPHLVETFTNDHDAHGSTAVNMFQLECSPDEAKKKYKGLRQIAKTINFIDQGYIIVA